MVHGNIHHRNQKNNRPDQTDFHLMNFLLCLIYLFPFSGTFLISGICRCSTITCLLYFWYNDIFIDLILVIGHLHTVGQQIYGYIFHSVNLWHTLFHTGRACRTRHTCDFITFLFHTFVLLYFISFWRVAQSSSTASSFPARMSSTTQDLICSANNTLLKEFSAELIADTCVKISTQ